MSETVSPKLDIAEGLFKETIWDSAVNAGLAALFAEAPYLAVPPLKWIITGLARMTTEKLYSLMKLAVDVSAIPLINNTHREAFDRESVKLKLIARNKGINSPEFKRARENAKAALAAFVRFNA